nr:MAG TPA: hypothetical protein [Caudoviricetes sp.]
MTKTRNINEEQKETIEKNQQIEAETDTNTVDVNAETLSTMRLEIYNKTYTIKQLKEINNKSKKTYLEKEITNRFRELMYNYYRGIKHAVLKDCCGQVYNIQDLKRELNKEETYNIIDKRCSRSNMRFDKATVDAIVAYIEEAEKE